MNRLLFPLFILINALGIVQTFGQCKANFTVTPNSAKGCEILTVKFEDKSTGLVAARSWNFGDGSPITGAQNPVHNYSAGVSDTIYRAYLAIECADGDADTMFVNVQVFARPKADFTVSRSEICAVSDSLCVNNLSKDLPGTTYNWEFGDFQSSKDKNPCHVYYSNGSMPVTLTVTNTRGCQEKVTKNIFVKPTPNPDFTVMPFTGCVPLSVIINNVTVEDSVPVTSWEWNFGDGLTYSGKNPLSHQYILADTFWIVLKAVNSAGCSNISSKAVLVSDSTKISLTYPSKACPGSKITLKAKAESNSFAKYSWDISDGTFIGPKNTPTVDVKWLTSGVKRITATVRVNGCDNIKTFFVEVSPTHEMSLFYESSSEICKGDDIAITAYPSGLNEYVWSSNGVELQRSAEAIINFKKLSRDTSFLVSAIDEYGCAFFTNGQIKVIEPPKVVLSGAPICEEGIGIFTAMPANYKNYDFSLNGISVQSGGQNTLSIENLSHTDKIQVNISSGGCSRSSSIISPNIVDSLKTPILNCGKSNKDRIEVIWDSVGDDANYLIALNGGVFISPTSGFAHTITGLTDGEEITFSLQASSPDPCKELKISETITCKAIFCPGANFDITYPEEVCKDDAVSINVENLVNVLGAYSISYNYKGSQDISESLNYNIPFYQGGNVEVVLTDSTSGCKPVRKLAEIKTRKSPELNVSVLNACSNQEATINVSPSNLERYIFSDETGTILQDDFLPYYRLADTSIARIDVRGESSLICNKPNSFTNILWSTVPDISLIADVSKDTICSGTLVSYTALPASFNRYRFYDGPILLQDSTINYLKTDSLESGNLIWVEADYNECISDKSNSISFIVLPKPLIELSAEKTTLCLGESITVKALPDIYDSYSFSFSKIQQTSISDTFFVDSPKKSDTVIVSVSSEKCSASDTLAIKVIELKATLDTYKLSADSSVALVTVAKTNLEEDPKFYWQTGDTTDLIYLENNNEEVSVHVASGQCMVSLKVKVDSTTKSCELEPCKSICINNSIILKPCKQDTNFTETFKGEFLSKDGDSFKFEPDRPGEYLATISYCHKRANFCIKFNYKLMACACDTTAPFIPNTITPNNDKKNDVWIIADKDIFPAPIEAPHTANVKIYNRWGDVVMEKNDYKNDWGGTDTNNNNLPDGAYFYEAKVEYIKIDAKGCVCSNTSDKIESHGEFEIQR